MPPTASTGVRSSVVRRDLDTYGRVAFNFERLAAATSLASRYCASVRIMRLRMFFHEIDPRLDRHEADNGLVPRRERLDGFSAVIVHFAKGEFCILGRERSGPRQM